MPIALPIFENINLHRLSLHYKYLPAPHLYLLITVITPIVPWGLSAARNSLWWSDKWQCKRLIPDITFFFPLWCFRLLADTAGFVQDKNLMFFWKNRYDRSLREEHLNNVEELKSPAPWGVYIMRDDKDVILYVGKAINLHNRKVLFSWKYRQRFRWLWWCHWSPDLIYMWRIRNSAGAGE